MDAVTDRLFQCFDFSNGQADCIASWKTRCSFWLFLFPNCAGTLGCYRHLQGDYPVVNLQIFEVPAFTYEKGKIKLPPKRRWQIDDCAQLTCRPLLPVSIVLDHARVEL